MSFIMKICRCLTVGEITVLCHLRKNDLIPVTFNEDMSLLKAPDFNILLKARYSSLGVPCGRSWL